MNKEPMSVNTLDEAAVACHEMYLSYIRAGFTERQALELVIAWVEQASRNASRPGQ